MSNSRKCHSKTLLKITWILSVCINYRLLAGATSDSLQQADSLNQRQPSADSVEARNSGFSQQVETDQDLDGAASEHSGLISANSHRIVATGWPSTSPMWPSIQIDESASASAGPSGVNEPKLTMAEPFIYADEPRAADYSLLLTPNKTVQALLKNHSKPLAVNLSFEYYFNHDPKITLLPGIRVEVDRKQFKYLEPNGQTIKARVWMKFNEKLLVKSEPSTTDVPVDAPDWLKFSLVNRQSPSLVAIRRLKVEFSMDEQPEAPAIVIPPVTSATTPPPPPNTTPLPPVPSTTPPTPATPSTPSLVPSLAEIAQEPPTTAAAVQPVQLQNEPNPEPPRTTPRRPDTSHQRLETQTPYQEANGPRLGLHKDRPFPAEQQYGGYGGGGGSGEGDYAMEDAQASASDSVLTSEIKPVERKRSSWWPGKRRRKREDTANAEAMTTNMLIKTSDDQQPKSIVLTCFSSGQCDWKPYGSEPIHWSLARMPPSTDTVQSGYYYVSNRDSYGDASKMLRLSLNQTDTATVADQNADHCLELALYITEKTYLKLFRLKRDLNADDSQWQKGSLLFTWAPTMATNGSQSGHPNRAHLPDSRLVAMESGQNGWTLETLCYGDFFTDPKECGSGRCAFGFEMESTDFALRGQQLPSEPLEGSFEVASGSLAEERLVSLAEQVVGVALLRDHSVNIPFKPNRAKWLETWQREEVEPGDNWKFYPKLDYKMGSNNISLLNLYDDSRYLVQSEWLSVDYNLDFTATLAIELVNSTTNLIIALGANGTSVPDQDEQNQLFENHQLFSLKMTSKLVDSNFNSIYTNNSTIDWLTRNTSTHLELGLPVSEHISAHQRGNLKDENEGGLFKIVLEFILDCHWFNGDPESSTRSNGTSYRLSLANVSLSDRCYPNPCQFGSCQQNGTGYDNWNCQCDERHRGRRCEFGRWCNIPHVTPWNPSQSNGKQVTLKTPTSAGQQQVRQGKLNIESVKRVSGKEFCERKLGLGHKCTEIDLPLNDNLYTDEDKTFTCSCQDDFYLSDDSRCKQAHLCNSVVCQAIGMICDESKPFNRTQPCHCNEKQDWYPDPLDPINRCHRRQCHDKRRDCGFDAHICLPTLPGEKPICKCGPKFTLKTDEKGAKQCQSTACVLPTLNDCQQVCLPDNSNLQRPYTCGCHPGFTLDADGRTCKPARSSGVPQCRPTCHSETQICTDFGCKCKQGYVGESEVIVQQQPSKNSQNQTNNTGPINYVQSVRCLNVCSLTYAENKAEFEMIESVCPLGLCDTSNFRCRCSDPSSSALVNTKYEPIYANSSLVDQTDGVDVRERISPLCHLRRVCDAQSSSYKICKSQGAICVPDYTKAAMFDCICPPSTEKKFFGQGTSSEFTCEPKCSAKKYDCLRRQAVCKLVDKDQVRCDCLPGLMFDQHDQKCYLAKYSYSFNLIIVNRYYEPESRYHKSIEVQTNATDSSDQKTAPRLFEINAASDHSNHLLEAPINEIRPEYSHQAVIKPTLKSIFITDYNQCNITQVLPKSVIEDPYEHDIESFLDYIDQCNEKIHQNVRTYHLNSRLSEDLRQSLRQHLRDFTVTTNNTSCIEIDATGTYLNCTIYLQSNEPISAATVDYVFNECYKNGQNENYCWIKPRLLLKKPSQLEPLLTPSNSSQLRNQLNFRQRVPCEIDNFCGLDAFSVRHDDKTSLCSCKCPADIEVIDVKELEPRQHEDDPTKVSVKEVCAPRNHCGANSTFCLNKSGSVCQYDIRLGSKCNCVYPSYEDSDGRCVEVVFSQLDNTLIIIIIMLGTGLIVSIAINLAAVAKAKSVFGRSKQYPLNEFPTSRSTNRSTGIPNRAFTND